MNSTIIQQLYSIDLRIKNIFYHLIMYNNIILVDSHNY
jgi:hypothetical protein